MGLRQKENVDNLHRLRSRGIGKHLMYLNEQMPTPNGVNHLLQFLYIVLKILPIFENKNQKWTFILCPYVRCYVTIRSFVLSFTLSYLLPLDPFLMDSRVFSINYYAHYVCKYTNYSAYFQILWKKLVVISFQYCIISTFLLLYGDKTAHRFHLTFVFFEYFA